jgi:hypothetical protein
VALLVLAATTASMAHQSVLGGLVQGDLFLVLGLIGVVVAWHQPRNPMGWTLLGIPFSFALAWLGRTYALLDYHIHHGHLPLGWVAILLGVTWAPVFVLAGLALLLYPDGRLPSARWKPVVRAYLTLGGIWVGGGFAVEARAVLGHHVALNSGGTLSSMDHPGGPDAWWGVISQAITYRRSHGERRQQLKWLLSGALVFLVSEIVLFADDTPSGWTKPVEVAATIGTFALPVSIGFGILKFRLYDIDRIISRTLGYTIVTGLLVGVYAGIVLLATQVLHHPGPVTVAVSTLVAAALFNPLRHRVQRAVDRRFNRARYDADQEVTAFASRLQDHVELDAVRADLLNVVSAALEPAHLSAWTAPAERGR